MLICNAKYFNKASACMLLSSLAMVAVGNAVVSSSAQAATLNAGFENGLNNWTSVGDVGIDNGAIGIAPLFGNSQALLTTGMGAASTGSVPTLEMALGLAPGALDTNPLLQAFEGSAVIQDVTVAAGETISFDYNFLTNDSNSTLPFTAGSPKDYGFVVLDGVVTSLADTDSSLMASGSSFNRETGYQSYTSAPLAAGTYSLGIGLVDVQDSIGNSALLIDAPQDVTASTPEPASGVGILFLLTVAGSCLKRKK